MNVAHPHLFNSSDSFADDRLQRSAHCSGSFFERHFCRVLADGLRHGKIYRKSMDLRTKKFADGALFAEIPYLGGSDCFPSLGTITP